MPSHQEICTYSAHLTFHKIMWYMYHIYLGSKTKFAWIDLVHAVHFTCFPDHSMCSILALIPPPHPTYWLLTKLSWTTLCADFVPGPKTGECLDLCLSEIQTSMVCQYPYGFQSTWRRGHVVGEGLKVLYVQRFIQ